MASPPPAAPRLLQFISEQEVAEIRKKRGDRDDDNKSGVPDRPLFEILKENKDKHQAEFNERFKHRPPKALDEDETEFLDKLEMYKKEQDIQLANEEAKELQNFQAAIASRTITFASEESKLQLQAPKEKVAPSSQKDKKVTIVKPLPVSVKIKPQPKKVKLEKDATLSDVKSTLASEKSTDSNIPLQGLVAYGSDSDEED